MKNRKLWFFGFLITLLSLWKVFPSLPPPTPDHILISLDETCASYIESRQSTFIPVNKKS